MVSKRMLLVSLILAVVCSSGLSFTAANYVDLKVNDKVLVSTEEYNRLKKNEQDFNKVLQLKEFIDANYYKDTSKVDYQDGILKGLFESLNDPYSVYMNKEEFAKFSEDQSGEYAGVGLVVTPGEDGLVTIVAPIEGSPAEKAGLKTNDKILRVNKKEVSTKNFDEAVKLMRGKPGTKVDITVYKAGAKDTTDLSLTRQIIVMKAVKSKMLANHVGYIQITSFDEKVAGEFKTNLVSLKDKGAKSLVIDLRNNPGGALDQCVKIADELLGQGLIVYTKARDGSKDTYTSDAAHKYDGKMAVLVNEGSASASEILTGALKDHKAAKIIGTKTFGKGIVQSVIPLKDGAAVKLTTSEYFTPNGKNIHKIGILPDIEVKEPKNAKAGEDLALKKALEILK